MHFLVQVHLLGGFPAVVVQDAGLLLIDLALDAQATQFLKDGHAVGIPGGFDKRVEGLDLIVDLSQGGRFHTGHLLGVQVHIRDGDEPRVEFVPQGGQVIIALQGLFQLVYQTVAVGLGLAHFQPQGALLVLQGRERPLPDLELLAHLRQRGFVVLEFNCHYLTQYLSISACLIPVSAGEKYLLKSFHAVSSISLMPMFTSMASSSRA